MTFNLRTLILYLMTFNLANGLLVNLTELSTFNLCAGCLLT